MKKNIIICIIILMCLLLAVGVMYVLDMNRMKNNKSVIFSTWGFDYVPSSYSDFIGTVLEETTTYMIVKPNEDEKESKSSDRIKINYGTEHIDYLYGIGRKVLIQYTGNIMETYPAEINANNIVTDGYLNFEIIVKNSNIITKRKILNNKELYKNNSDFDLYYYGLEKVNVKVDNKTMSLEDALKSGKITLDGIISKADMDVKETQEKYDGFEKSQSVPKILPYLYGIEDGGSIVYKYDTYTIIKANTLDGNRNIYIGRADMIIDDVI